MEAGPGTVPNYDGPPEQTVSGTAPAPQAGPPAPAPAPQAAPTAPVAPAAPVPQRQRVSSFSSEYPTPQATESTMICRT